jgi:SNF2 family DNA or RNA helicase
MSTLRIRALNIPPAIEVRRGESVPDGFWLAVLANWGPWGRQPATRLLVPREVFLARLAWLPDACRAYDVGLDWDDASISLIRNVQAERRTLAYWLQAPTDLSGADVTRRLDGSRFAGDLRPFQVRDLGRLLALENGANFSVPGAGKTAVTYAVFEAERMQGRVDRLLVVAPISAFEAWREEAKRWLNPLPLIHTFTGNIPPDAEVLLVNYQRLLFAYEAVSYWVLGHSTHVVLDEAHRMKRGWAGRWGRACLNLAHLAKRRDILTGTPAPQHPRDLVALMDFCWPGQGARLLPQDSLDRAPLPDAIRRAGESIRPLFVRTTKAELGLPAPKISVIEIPLEGLQLEIYEALRNRYAGLLRLSPQERMNYARMGRVAMYLLEAAINPSLLPSGSSPSDPPSFMHPPLEVPPDSPLAELIREYGKYETPPKFVELVKILQAHMAEGKKTVVWSHFVRNLDLLRNKVLTAIRPALVHGGLPVEPGEGAISRVEEMRRFREDPDCLVLLANPAALGEGVSLHDVCRDAVYLDRTFNAGQYLQSLDRIHRLGLQPTDEVEVTICITQNTIDEVVDRRVGQKAERLSMLLDDRALTAMVLPDEEDYGPPIETDTDVAALFEHLQGAELPPDPADG